MVKKSLFASDSLLIGAVLDRLGDTQGQALITQMKKSLAERPQGLRRLATDGAERRRIDLRTDQSKDMALHTPKDLQT